MNNYEIKMVIENNIPCLISMSVRYINAKLKLYYEISSKQSMYNIYENREIGYSELHKFLLQFHKILLTMEEYLINANHLLIDPKFLYMNIETSEISFLYYPNNDIDSKEAFKKMAEYILNKINHLDEKAVFLAYKLYKETRNSNFTLHEILNHSESDYFIKDSISDKCTKVQENESHLVYESLLTPKDEDMSVNKENKENTDSINFTPIVNEKEKEQVIDSKKMYIIAGIFLCILVFLLYCYNQNLLLENISYDQFLIMIGTTAMIISGCVFKIYLNKKRLIDNHDDEIPDVCNRTEKEIIEEKIDTVQLYDFLSGEDFSLHGEDKVNEIPFALTEENGKYGDTVLLDGFCNQTEKQILVGINTGKEEIYKIEDLPFTVGKSSEHVNLELKDDSISRMHARFFKREGKLYLEDLNSTNGTFKNGMRLEANETVKVELEDEISFAKLTFVYH